MTPTHQQNILLKNYLRKSLQYRETYEEVYDHMISALAQQEIAGSFEDAVNHIICTDFGGHRQLVEMEDAMKKMAVKEGINKYLLYMSDYFKWPALLNTICYVLVTYYLSKYILFPAKIVEAFIVLVLLFPVLLSAIRYYRIGYKVGDTKRSVKDDVFKKITSVPSRLFVLSNILIVLYFGTGHHAEAFVSPVLVTILLVLSAIYSLALLKLYKDEFRISSMTKN